MSRKVTFLLCFLMFLAVQGTLAQTYKYAKQGFSMLMPLDNRGAFGRVSYRGVIGGTDPGPDSIGLEFPLGQPYEHLFGAGLWVGGKLDTARVGTSPEITAVTTGYEGWIGPYFEFFPGTSAADSIFKIYKPYPPKPPGWDDPSGLEGAIPYHPISDADFYMKYTDDRVRVANHVPLHLKVFQSSYSWNDPYAEGIIILEYRIVNNGTKTIDSAYVGFFADPDVGPYRQANYQLRNFCGYMPDARCAYAHNPADRGSTPVGFALLNTSIPATPDSLLRYSFRWFNGSNGHPNTDAEKYARMSSGLIDSSGSINNLSDIRFIFSFGPFTIHPCNPPLPGISPDTVLIAIAVVSAFDSRGNHLRKLETVSVPHALDIYINQGIHLPATPASPPLRAVSGDRSITLNWLWTPADSVGSHGRPNPVSSWDKTNTRARAHPTWTGIPGFASRISDPPPGVSPDSGGRNFESFRLWRSENPDYPDNSFTLLRQWDVAGDSVEYDTGLEYSFVDTNLVRGKTYVYAVTSKSMPNIVSQPVFRHGHIEFVPTDVPPLESGLRVNAVPVTLPFATSNTLGRVRVVPNPYRTDKDYTLESGGYEGLNFKWDESRRIIKFINLPVRCTIRVFSLAGDLVRTIQHDGGVGSAFPKGDHDMELVSESNRALASGLYVFTVESDLGTQVGKFVIIR